MRMLWGEGGIYRYEKSTDKGGAFFVVELRNTEITVFFGRKLLKYGMEYGILYIDDKMH